jgi:hypothetical protein
VRSEPTVEEDEEDEEDDETSSVSLEEDSFEDDIDTTTYNAGDESEKRAVRPGSGTRISRAVRPGSGTRISRAVRPGSGTRISRAVRPGSGTRISRAVRPGSGTRISRAVRPGSGTRISRAVRPGSGTRISRAVRPGSGTHITRAVRPGGGISGKRSFIERAYSAFFGWLSEQNSADWCKFFFMLKDLDHEVTASSDGVRGKVLVLFPCVISISMVAGLFRSIQEEVGLGAVSLRRARRDFQILSSLDWVAILLSVSWL